MIRNDKQNAFKVMRSRIRHSTYEKLRIIAKSESERTGRHIYVADLVRDACRKYIKNHPLNSEDNKNTFTGHGK